jgi:hypothetical protein
MTPLDYISYVSLEEHRLHHEAPTAAERAHAEWVQWQRQIRLARRHALARWAGRRLVRLGERLQHWAEAASASGRGSRGPVCGC